MSKFTAKIIEKVTELNEFLKEDIVDEIVESIEMGVGRDLEDTLSDFDEEDIIDEFIDRKPSNAKYIILDNIQAESEIEDLLSAFKQKYPLTEIY